MHPDVRYRGAQLQQDPESGDFWAADGPVSSKSDAERAAATRAGLQTRCKRGLSLAVTMYLIVTPLLRESGLVPPWMSRAALLLGMAALAFRLLTFRRWGDEMPYARRFFVAFGLLILELSIENFFIWAVAASDLRKYKAQEPLQDNISLLFGALQAHLPAARRLFVRPWAEILQLLVALIMLGVSVLFDQVPFSGFGMMTRAIHTIIATRIIRTAAFMLTVLPSQRPGCFGRRFPKVPSSWWRFLVVGFTQLRASGGCNDLVISGHAIIYAVAPLAFQAYYPGRVAWLLWLGVLHSCIRAPLTNQHYSVDMFLAVVVTALVWHWSAWAYDSKVWRERHSSEPADPRQWMLTLLILVVLATLAYIIIVGGA